MKINQSIRWNILLPILLFSILSCQKTLEEKPLSFLSTEYFYTNEADAKAAINSVYSALLTDNLYLQPMWNLTMLDDDHVSGVDWFLGTSGAGNPQAYWGVDGPWVGCYTIISRANTVLENIIKINKIDSIIKQRILGEAYFFRGWAYLQLVQLYGEVPLRLKSLSFDPTIVKIRKSLVIDVYNQIIADFKNAESNLLPLNNPKANELGRVTRGVAKGFLAKTYLTMASGASTGNVSVRGGADNGRYEYRKNIVAGLETISSPKEYFKLAKDKALEVIESGEYSLFSNWPDLWLKSNRNKTEHMWQLQALENSAFVNELSNYISAFSTFGRGAMWFTNNHYKDYDTTDLRVLNGVTHNYEMNNASKTKYFYPSWQSYKYKVINGLVYANDGKGDDRAYTIKYSDVSNPTVSRSDAHFSMIRFAEMYLIVAESDNEINDGPTLLADSCLNRIRTRAKAQPTPKNLTRDEFRSFVIAERAREFVLEGIRRYDLMRWGIYLQVMNKVGVGQNNINKIRNSRNLLLPIPQSELNSNTLILTNNPGW